MMKRTIILLTLMTGCFLCIAKGSLAAQKLLTPTDKAIRDASGWNATVVFQEFNGPVANIEENLKIFAQEFNQQKLLPIGPPIGIFNEAPRTAKDAIRYELAFPVSMSEKEPLQIREPLKMKELKYGKVVKLMHTGPYTDLFKFYTGVSKSVNLAKYEIQYPVIHQFIDNPSMVKAAVLRTQVIIPVKPDLQKTLDSALTQASPFATTVVSQEFQGPVSGLEDNMKAFTDMFFKQGFLPTGPPMGIFYEQPQDEQTVVRYALAFPVASTNMRAMKVEEPLKIQNLKFKKTMKFEHVGPYQDLFRVHNKLTKSYKTARAGAPGPVIHQFIDNPALVKSNDLRTEVLVPVQ